jgi:hypothetical protein
MNMAEQTGFIAFGLTTALVAGAVFIAWALVSMAKEDREDREAMEAARRQAELEGTRTWSTARPMNDLNAIAFEVTK